MSDLADREREKYERVWTFPSYRRVSPGEQEVGRAFYVMECAKLGRSLIDYGAGPGRATYHFQTMGLDVLAVDHAANALETEVPFRQACLWDMPGDLGPSDFAFCCDVMEHIPPEKVDAVLEGIARRTKVAAFFRIALHPDSMGARTIGEPLHLTVQPAEWWLDRLMDAAEWAVVPLESPSNCALFVCSF